MKKQIFTLGCAMMLSSLSLAATPLEKINCRFADANGVKLGLTFKKDARKKVHGYSQIDSKETGRNIRPIQQLSMDKTAMIYKASVKNRKGASLAPKRTAVKTVNFFRGQQSDAVTAFVSVYVPQDMKVLRSNNPQTSRAFTMTKASVIYSSGNHSNMNGYCWL